MFEKSNATINTNLNDELGVVEETEPSDQVLPKSYQDEFHHGGPAPSGISKYKPAYYAEAYEDDVGKKQQQQRGDEDEEEEDEDASSQFYPYEEADDSQRFSNAPTLGLIHSSSNPKLSSFAKRSEPIPEEIEEEYEEEYEEETTSEEEYEVEQNNSATEKKLRF
jgi:hypothetical protein